MIKRHKVLYDSSAAGTGDWFRLDNRYDESPERILQVYMTAGDTITLQGATKDLKGVDSSTVTASLETEDITDIVEYISSNAGDVLTGPWTYIRIVKTGTTGAAKVQGFI